MFSKDWLSGALQNAFFGDILKPLIGLLLGLVVAGLVSLLAIPIRKRVRMKYAQEEGEAKDRIQALKAQEAEILRTLEERSAALIKELRDEVGFVKEQQRFLTMENARLHHEVARLERYINQLVFELATRNIPIPPIPLPVDESHPVAATLQKEENHGTID